MLYTNSTRIKLTDTTAKNKSKPLRNEKMSITNLTFFSAFNQYGENLIAKNGMVHEAVANYKINYAYHQQPIESSLKT